MNESICIISCLKIVFVFITFEYKTVYVTRYMKIAHKFTCLHSLVKRRHLLSIDIRIKTHENPHNARHINYMLTYYYVEYIKFLILN